MCGMHLINFISIINIFSASFLLFYYLAFTLLTVAIAIEIKTSGPRIILDDEKLLSLAEMMRISLF